MYNNFTMDHIRFNQPQNREVPGNVFKDEPRYEETRSAGKSRFKGILVALLIIVVLAGVAYGAWYWSQKKSTFVVYDVTASPYYAVFLTNGQVYFGKPVSKSRSEFVLADVYYLQVSGEDTTLSQQQSTEQRFALVKLGQEIHGPTDRLFINNQNILFYEQLSKESRAVQSIAEKK